MYKWFRKVTPIGLDIGHSRIKMVQLACNDEHIKVIAAEQTEPTYSDGDDEKSRDEKIVSAIKRMYVKGGFVGSEVISCLSNDELKSRSLRLDATNEKQVEEVLQDEASHRLGLDGDTYEINYMLAGNVRQGEEIKTEVILFAVEKEVIRRHIRLLEKAGLMPVAIDSIPCALFRSFEKSLRRQEDKEVVSVFVDIGSCYTTLLIGRGRDICFIKQIPVGGRRLNEEIASKFGISVEEAIELRNKARKSSCDGDMDGSLRQGVADATNLIVGELAREILLCFKYFAVSFRGSKPQRVIFGGGEVHDETLLSGIAKQLEMEIEVSEPFKGIEPDCQSLKELPQSSPSEWTVAVGLCMKGLETGGDRSEVYEGD